MVRLISILFITLFHPTVDTQYFHTSLSFRSWANQNLVEGYNCCFHMMYSHCAMLFPEVTMAQKGSPQLPNHLHNASDEYRTRTELRQTEVKGTGLSQTYSFCPFPCFPSVHDEEKNLPGLRIISAIWENESARSEDSNTDFKNGSRGLYEGGDKEVARPTSNASIWTPFSPTSVQQRTFPSSPVPSSPDVALLHQAFGSPSTPCPSPIQSEIQPACLPISSTPLSLPASAKDQLEVDPLGVLEASEPIVPEVASDLYHLDTGESGTSPRSAISEHEYEEMKSRVCDVCNGAEMEARVRAVALWPLLENYSQLTDFGNYSSSGYESV